MLNGNLKILVSEEMSPIGVLLKIDFTVHSVPPIGVLLKIDFTIHSVPPPPPHWSALQNRFHCNSVPKSWPINVDGPY